MAMTTPNWTYLRLEDIPIQRDAEIRRQGSGKALQKQTFPVPEGGCPTQLPLDVEAYPALKCPVKFAGQPRGRRERFDTRGSFTQKWHRMSGVLVAVKAAPGADVRSRGEPLSELHEVLDRLCASV